MPKEELRKEKLSIYLVRESWKADSEILKLENAKQPIELEIPESERATLYIKKDPPSASPPWTRLFTTLPQVPIDAFGTSSSVGAVFIVRADGHVFILSFGTGFHLIKGEAVERDFGLKVTLNSVDPDNLRSLDKANYDHNPLNSRTQSPKGLDIFEFHVDSELDILYAITGASQVDIFGSHVTGRDALIIAVKVELIAIVKILKEAYNRYKSKLPQQFDWVDNINRVRDPTKIELLELELDSSLKKGNIDNIWLGEPEIVDWEAQIGYSFDLYSRTPRHVVLKLSDYADYLREQKMDLSVESLKNGVVHANNNEYQSIRSWSVYRCLYAEIAVEKEIYILMNGLWYRVNPDFIKTVDLYLSNLDSYVYKFPVYSHDREEDYNECVAINDASFVLMDKKNTKIGGRYDKLEFCDLIKDGYDFIHVKYYRSSSTLSHLFSQGYVAAEAFVKDVDFREKVNLKLPKAVRLANPKIRPNPSNYKVVYAIATEKNLPNELPFFSKVTLKNSLKTLMALDYRVELSRIDVDPSLLIKKKCKPKTKK